MKRTTFLLALLCLLTASLPLTGCQRKKLRDTSPTGLVIATDGGKAANLARRYVYSYVPRELQPAWAKVRISEKEDIALKRLRMRDRLSPMTEPPRTLLGYCQMPLNNPDEQTDVTNIYLLGNLGEDRTAHVGLHEYGHLVHWGIANAGERAAWEFLYARLESEGKAAPGYEQAGALEGAAEYFAIWCVDKSRVPSEVRAYFDKLEADRRD